MPIAAGSYDFVTAARGALPGPDVARSMVDMAPRFDVVDLMTEARSGLRRLSPTQAQAAVQQGALILDTRQDTDRWSNGVVPGSIHLPRTVLEWRVDPASGHQHPQIIGFDQRLIVMCNEGYSSSLAAHTLQRLGFANATDMIGGFAAWWLAGLPTEPQADRSLVEHHPTTPRQPAQIPDGAGR